MRRQTKVLHALTAGDVMRRVGVILPQRMSLTAAARLLLERQPRAAPVIAPRGDASAC